MTRLQPGAGVIISWEPDCSPQVMTVIPSSRTRTNKDRDNGQPGPTRALEHVYDWNCLTLHTFVLWFLMYLKLTPMSVPWRWLKMGWVLTLPSPAVSQPCNQSPFSALHHVSLFGVQAWVAGVNCESPGVWSWGPNLQFQLHRWIKNSSFWLGPVA
jgi:hypothetical protein